jgi:hypothetical protein
MFWMTCGLMQIWGAVSEASFQGRSQQLIQMFSRLVVFLKFQTNARQDNDEAARNSHLAALDHLAHAL